MADSVCWCGPMIVVHNRQEKARVKGSSMSQSKELPMSGENPFFGGDIAERDPDIARVLGNELTRQKTRLS